jgi:hybrid cluster-associated redox disulfide protein
MARITEDTTLTEVLEHPKAKEVLEKYNLPCLQCPFAEIEAEEIKIGQICQQYGIETKKLLKELNDNVKN